MKHIKSFGLAFMLVIFIVSGANAQLGKMLNKVKNKIVDKAIGNENQSGNQASEPDCASDDAVVAFEFDKGYTVDMNEISVTIKNGDILLYARNTSNYFIKRADSDSPEGPFSENDPEVRAFENHEAEVNPENSQAYAVSYPGIIFRTGDKYEIKLDGQTYGPFAVIQTFVINLSKTKFVAAVTPDVLFTENEQKQMQNAENKTQTEQMAMAMQMAQKMQQRMAGGATDIQQKIVSNIEGVSQDMMYNATLSSEIKFDDIVWVGFDKITDLFGNTLLNIDHSRMNVQNGNFWLSSDNKSWATFSYGQLTFSDGKILKDLFAPYRAYENGKPSLVYMYFSPKHNAIMKVAIPF
ncbi:MAG: hypothetical protein JW833_13545 [Prolixibacteraceae bacterium]|nr:hypothetical protein [Prolixibacteraceae bacterium]